jgi:hypothetical protein
MTPLTRRSRLAAWSLCCALLLPSACQLYARSGPTEVAQGRYFSTGKPEYDEFFIDLHRMQVELNDAPERAAAPRAALAEKLDTGIDTEVLKEALKKRASELAGRSVKLAVEKPSDPAKPLTLRVTGAPSRADAELKATIEETLGKGSELRLRANGWLKLLEELPGRATALEGGVDPAFVGKSPGKRAEIKRNLADAKKVVELLLTRAKDAERSNTELLEAVTSALGEAEPAAKAEAEATGADEKPAEKKKARRASPPPAPKARPARAPKPVKPAAPPPPKPAAAAPAPKPEKSDVAPPPKPTQGTAKPDFEP